MRQRAERMWRSPAVLWASVGIMAVVAACAAVVAFSGGGKPASPAAAVAGRSVPARAPHGGCSVPAGDQRVPLDPPRAHWDNVGDWQAPGSTVVGPMRVSGRLRECYARSPVGAVFAAVNFGVLANTYHADVELLRELTASGQTREMALRRGGEPATDPNVHMEVIGFRVTDYSPAEATVMVAMRVAPKPSAEMALGQSGSQLGAVTVRLRWERGDWKAVIEPDGFQAEVLDSIAGLVPWGAS